MKKLLLVGLFICISYTTNAQISTFLEKGQNGVGIEALAEKGGGIEGYGGKIGCTLKGIVDIEFTMTHDIYDKERNDLITSNATAVFYSGKATWWLYRTTITPGIEANVGILGGFEYSSYNNYKYLNSVNGNTVDYQSFGEGTFGLETSVNLQLSKTWFFQPQYSVQLEAGSEKELENNQKLTHNYIGLVTNIGAAVFRRMPEFGTIYFDVDEFLDTYGSGNYYFISLGYIYHF